MLPFGIGSLLINNRMELFKLATPNIPQDQLGQILDNLDEITVGDEVLPSDANLLAGVATELKDIICEGILDLIKILGWYLIL